MSQAKVDPQRDMLAMQILQMHFGRIIQWVLEVIHRNGLRKRGSSRSAFTLWWQKLGKSYEGINQSNIPLPPPTLMRNMSKFYAKGTSEIYALLRAPPSYSSRTSFVILTMPIDSLFQLNKLPPEGDYFLLKIRIYFSFSENRSNTNEFCQSKQNKRVPDWLGSSSLFHVTSEHWGECYDGAL